MSHRQFERAMARDLFLSIVALLAAAVIAHV